MLPKVYIILLNYKLWKDTIECLESLFRLEYPNFQVVVVDNPTNPHNNSLANIQQWARGELVIDFSNSPLQHLVCPPVSKPIEVMTIQEKEVDILPKFNENTKKPQLILIQAQENRGFAVGNNIAIRYCLQQNDFDYIWILNNDTVVEKEALTHLVATYEANKHTKLGILGGKVRYYHFPDTLQCAAGATYNKWLAYGKQIGTGQKDKGQFDNTNFRFDLVIGACMFVSKHFIEKVGLLGEDYFLYFEEQDWAERAKRAGFRLGYTHKAVIYHKEGSTVGGNQLNIKAISKLSDFYYARSKILFTRKFHQGLCLFTVYLSFGIVLFNRLIRGQYDRIRMILGVMLNPKKMYENS
ncbi:MAG: glycosyltransferase family 2 protein [Microscillaceae bacterium]|nr:glycosyltransferase family 2 protein [Microscillaceae bacterium]MDW8461215.1 glycosyltransferase family 2 protein [Cytophagales bacterium]